MTTRRKVTRDTIRQRNAARDRNLRYKKRPLGWNDLENQRKNAEQYLQMAAPAILLGRDQAFINSLTAEQKTTFVGLMQNLSEGMTEAKAQYDALKAKHEGRTGAAKGMIEEMDVLVLGEEYITWMGEFEQKVRPFVYEILEFSQNRVEKILEQPKVAENV